MQQEVVYLLDQPTIRQLIQQVAPECVERLDSVTRPIMSKNPDELELWETELIRERKRRQSYENDFIYLLRFLYEESFSVNQTLGSKRFKGSYGYTVGGLISHCYGMGFASLDGNKTDPFRVEGLTLREALSNEKNPKKRAWMIGAVYHFTYPIHFGRAGRAGGPSQHAITCHMRDPQRLHEDELNASGFRLLRLLTEKLELCGRIEDEIIERRFGIRGSVLPFLLTRYWQEASKNALNEEGYVRPESDAIALEGLRLLLELRTHPAFGAIYKYFSPSGYLNEQ